MGAPTGNNNASKAKVWSAAIERALSNRSALTNKNAIDALAERLLAKCDEGDMSALKELGDRLEGKPAQGIDLGSDPNRPVRMEIGLPWLSQQIQARNSE